MYVTMVRRLAGLAGLWATLAGPAAAQTLAVRVVEDSSRAPLAGALVRVFDGSRPVAQGLTNEGGRLRLALPGPATYIVRVGRIGYTITRTWTVTMAVGERRALDIALAGQRVILPDVVVESDRRCEGVSGDRATAAVLWDQVRQALTATAISERAPVRYRIGTFKRERTVGGTIRREQRSAQRTGTGRPFGTLPADELARNGFVRLDDGDREYFGPDAQLLLSNAFVATHCFRLVQAPDSMAGAIGLGFEPSPRPDQAEIQGVLWVDRASAHLRSLEFEFVGPRSLVPTEGAGGYVRFERRAEGQWYIPDWMIRMPLMGEIRGFHDGQLARDTVLGYLEQGGTAVPAERDDPSLRPALLTGFVFDSLAAVGLEGVRVSVAGSDPVLTDSLGTFTLPVSIAGDVLVTFDHQLLGLEPGRGSATVRLRPGLSTHVVIGTPSPETLGARVCGGPGHGPGLAGLARTASGIAIPDAAVSVRWFDRLGTGGLQQRTEATRSDGLGRWAICELPPGYGLTVSELDGRRVLAAIEARAPDDGFGWVDLRRGRRDDLAFAAPPDTAAPAATPQPVARDAAAPSPRLRVFERRRADGVGRFFTRADLAVLDREALPALLQRVSGVRLITVGGVTALVTSRRRTVGDLLTLPEPWPPACYLQVMVDGVFVWRPSITEREPYDVARHRVADLAGVEVYTGVQTPSELGGSGYANCGTLVLWHR